MAVTSIVMAEPPAAFRLEADLPVIALRAIHSKRRPDDVQQIRNDLAGALDTPPCLMSDAPRRERGNATGWYT